MKNNMMKIVLWLLGIMIGSFLVASIIFLMTGYSNAKPVSGFLVNEERALAVDKIKNIQVNGISEDIKVIPTETNEVKVHYYGNVRATDKSFVPELNVTNYEDSLVVKVSRKPIVGFNIGFANNTNIDVYIPKTYQDNISVNTISGNISISNMNINNFICKSTSGEINSTALNTKSSNIETISGNTILTGFGGDINCTSVSGDISLEYLTFANKMNIQTTSGKATVRLPENAQFYLKSNTVSGDVKTQFPMSIINNTRTDLEGTVGNSDNKIIIKTTSGDIDINK